MKILKETRDEKNKYNFPKIGDLEGDAKILGFTPQKGIEDRVNNILKKNKFIYDYLKEH